MSARIANDLHDPEVEVFGDFEEVLVVGLHHADRVVITVRNALARGEMAPEVDNDPAVEAEGRDQQLEKAVEVLLATIDG